MAKQAKEILDVEEIKVLADKGYYSTKDLIECDANQIETYVPKQKFTGSIANMIKRKTSTSVRRERNFIQARCVK
jgi:hypothetical protein